MGGSSKKATVGYWYKLLYHAGLCKGPFDAFLEFRGGDKTAWKGELTASGTISINQPGLWGGEKVQGGIVSDVDVLFGEATQAANAYLLANLGAQVPAWRGLGTLVFKGGKYGANNPYPKTASYKLRKIKEGWDSGCWYPEKAAVPGSTFSLLVAATDVWKYKVVEAADGGAMGLPAAYISPSYDDSAWAQSTGPFSSGAPPGTYIPTGSVGRGIWLRRKILVTGAPSTIGDITITFTHDDGGWVWWNGALVASFSSAGASTITIPSASILADNTVVFQVLDSVPTGTPTGFSASASLANTVGQFGMNPAHALYFARTNSDLGREPTANINAASLTAAADTLYAEGFGICTSRDPAQESVEEFEQRICKLIGGSFSRDPITGLWNLDLARGNYVLGDLPILTDDDILDFKELPPTLDNAINSVSITYFDPEKKETITTPPAQARALIQAFGTIHQTIEYREIPTAELAARIALRELRATATPTRAFDLVCTRKPYAWRPNTYFRLQVPKRGIADMVCIVGEKQSGSLKSGAIRLRAAQDIYTMPAFSFVDIEPGVDTRPGQLPAPVALQVAIEAPYIVVVATLDRTELSALPVDAGYLLTMAADPAVSTNYTLMVDAGAGYAEVAPGDWCPSGTVSAAATRTTTAITMTGGTRLDEVLVGSAALWDTEIVRIDAINTSTGAVTVARGCADTVPATHASGARIWFFGGNEVFDSTEYAAPETINAKLLTNTGSQQLALTSATALPLTFADRLVRPYPPGLVKIAGADWPASVSGSFSVTWAHRNRVQQSDQIVDTTAASITPADNIRYGLRFRRTDTNAVLVERSDIGPPTATVTLTYTGNVSLELWTIDDGGASWQSHLFTFAYTPPASPTNTITATAYTPVFNGTIVDGGTV